MIENVKPDSKCKCSDLCIRARSKLPKARQTDLKVGFVHRNLSEFEFFYVILGFGRGRPPPLCLSQPIRLQKTLRSAAKRDILLPIFPVAV